MAVADGCDRMRRAFAELRLPEPGEWAALADEQNTETIFLLIDMERTLDQIALAVPRYSEELGQSKIAPAGKRSLFLPDAFDNPEYVRFAIKGTLASLICYVVFIGFDYPGIYTSMITCYVVSLSTIGASNQKGILRFGGAAVGGVMGLFALVYLFPNMDTIGGFWLVFGAGTAVAAWVNFGTPRISYGGYQIGIAFLQSRPTRLWPGPQRHCRPRSSDRRILRAHRVRYRRAPAVARSSPRRAAGSPGRDAALAGGSCSVGNER